MPTPAELEAAQSKERVRSLGERLELELERVELDDAAAIKESCGRADAVKQVQTPGHRDEFTCRDVAACTCEQHEVD